MRCVCVDAMKLTQATVVGGAVAGGAAAGGSAVAITDAKVSKSIMSSISAASSASVASVSSASVASAWAENHKSGTWIDPNKPTPYKTGPDPFTFTSSPGKTKSKYNVTNDSFTFTFSMTKSKRSGPAAITTPPTVSIPPPPGTPVSTLPPTNRPSEVPAGVPEYNFRMCQYDIIKMGQNKVNLVFDQPLAQSESLPPVTLRWLI